MHCSHRLPGKILIVLVQIQEGELKDCIRVKPHTQSYTHTHSHKCIVCHQGHNFITLDPICFVFFFLASRCYPSSIIPISSIPLNTKTFIHQHQSCICISVASTLAHTQAHVLLHHHTLHIHLLWYLKRL